MTTFDRLAPYIQDYIYRERWDELREVQVAACDILFNTDKNLLLATGTASGKTEAAFLPALTLLHEMPARSVGILYISPLKALINDQFYRLDYLLREGDVPVCKWHGDASQTAKRKLLQNPQGVLQITPESLESLLINKHSLCINLFGDLRFVIIDEVHYFMGSPRGIQLLCQLERIQKLTGLVPRRIGLSATLGDYTAAERWLNAGTGRACTTPIVAASKRKIGIAMELFEQPTTEEQLQAEEQEKRDQRTGQHTDATDSVDTVSERAHFEYLYKHTRNKKAILFANSRATVEFAIANLKKIAEEHHTPDIYRVHHGNISAILREETEKEMKHSEQAIVTGATVTLELGVDIGTLDRIAQIGAPFSVSSFTQRLGRCGRRGQSAEILFTFMEEEKSVYDGFAQMHWEFLKGIAILQLYLEERWVEPIVPPRFPYALLYHQTMAYLAARGETAAPVLAQNILGLCAFQNIPQQDYKLLIQHLLAIEQLQRTERGGLMIGRKGERIISHYEFYSVFESPVEYLVKCENQAIGTIQALMPIGAHFSLAGSAWECLSIDDHANTIFVKRISGVSKNAWLSTQDGETHTKILQKMQQVLNENKTYAYLSPRCVEKLNSMRAFARKSGFSKNRVTALTGSRYALFPWLGTRQLCALYLFLESKGFAVQDRIYYLVVDASRGVAALEKTLASIATSKTDKHRFSLPENTQIAYKYNDFVPKALLRKQFVEDFIDFEGLVELFGEGE